MFNIDLKNWTAPDESYEDRKNQMQSAAENNARICELEHVVAYLIAKMLRGEKASFADSTLRRFMRLPDDAAVHPEKYLQIALQSVEPRGLLECSKCGSKTKDIPGFTDEKCIVCGTRIGSDG
jgi:hypothetical protein